MSGTGAINITPFCELRIAPWPLEMPDIYQTSTTTPTSSGLIIDEDWSVFGHGVCGALGLVNLGPEAPHAFVYALYIYMDLIRSYIYRYG